MDSHLPFVTIRFHAFISNRTWGYDGRTNSLLAHSPFRTDKGRGYDRTNNWVGTSIVRQRNIGADESIDNPNSDISDLCNKPPVFFWRFSGTNYSLLCHRRRRILSPCRFHICFLVLVCRWPACGLVVGTPFQCGSADRQRFVELPHHSLVLGTTVSVLFEDALNRSQSCPWRASNPGGWSRRHALACSVGARCGSAT